MAAVTTGVSLDTASLEQIVAEQERVQQHTAEQIVHVPIPQIQEEIGDSFPERVEEQIVDIPVPPTVQQSTKEQIVVAPVRQVVEEQLVAKETTQNFGEIPKDHVAPTPAAIDADTWMENLESLDLLPLTERLRLKREAEAKSAERAAAELLGEDMDAGGPIQCSIFASRQKGEEGQAQKVSCGQCTRWLLSRGCLASPDSFNGCPLRGTRICFGILAARLSFTMRCRSDGDDDSEFI